MGAEGNLLTLTGGLRVIPRVQHPKVHEAVKSRQDGWWWFFRYWADEVRPVRKRQWLGPSRGEKKISKKEAEIERDKFLAVLNAPTERQVVAKGMALFGEMARMYITSHLERKNKIAAPTREKAKSHLELHIIPRWGNKRLNEIEPKEVEDWLYETFESWWTMNGVRNVMSAIYHKAEEWGYWEEGKRSPIVKVDIGKRTYKRPRRIPTMEETVQILDHLPQPHDLIIETCIATSTRISEVLGLKLKHLDLEAGAIAIEQRVWHGEVDEPKSESSHRTLALGYLVERYRAWVKAKNITDQEAWIFAQEDNPEQPMWDSGVRKALHAAARAVGCDFPGLGPHSFRRANITWRQEVGASAIEAQKIAGHSSVEMTGEYTFVGIRRQDELTRAIQEKLAAAGKKNDQAAKQVTRDGGAGPAGRPSLAEVAPATAVVQ